ncbi:hypothetical protein ACK8P5_26595 (plasmid) [Paenibacillus sp. EC2-1]|uniref:hypothetical protein n=1 Tax=Paenibacillus sp. EC2-1 TaxID=3388665 RepID=UPI003BEF3B5F
MLNWPTAIVIVAIVITIGAVVSSIVGIVVNHNRPIARTCSRCQQDIENAQLRYKTDY